MGSFGESRSVGAAVEDDVAAERAGDLALPLTAFENTSICAYVYEQFLADDTLVAAAVVDGEGRVVGIVNRLMFMARYAQRYIPEIYAKRSIMALANSRPFLIDENVSVAELAAMIALDHVDALRECFVVTREGRYLGIGTSEALVRAKLTLLSLREQQLRTALLAAHEASQTKSNFLALMSHELRTPLNAIIGFSEILTGELFGPHSVPRYGEYAGDIMQAGKHLLALINDILDLSKAEAGRLDLNRERIFLPEMFDECLRLVRERAKSQGLSLVKTVPSNLPDLEADRLRLKQILLNLLSNAVKFTPPGGEIELAARRNSDGGIALRIRDTGLGIAPENIALALEPFRQIASPLARKSDGTGLGLSLVKSLTELMGGKLSIQSVPNQGTTVHVSFPSSSAVEREDTSEAQ